ncbi:MAG: hypothetical protein LUE21_08905 [Oscillospiraceae bacterium]|nr:hypothetical protein [Oscillospiraceae bacterium]
MKKSILCHYFTALGLGCQSPIGIIGEKICRIVCFPFIKFSLNLEGNRIAGGQNRGRETGHLFFVVNCSKLCEESKIFAKMGWSTVLFVYLC